MKKLSLYIMSLLLIGFTACTEDFNEDVAGPQTNPQEPALNIDFQIGNTEITDFDLNTDADSVVVLKETSLPVYTETATVIYELEISGGTDFAKKAKAPVVFNGDTYKAATADLTNAVIELYGRKPEARALYSRLVSYVTDNGQTVYSKSNTVNLKMTPKAPVIEEAYYIIGDMNGWPASDVSKLVKFNHSGKDVYEDPVFSVVVEVPDNCSWKIVPHSLAKAVEDGLAENVWGDGILGCEIDGDTSEEGTLVVRKGGYDPGAIKIEDAGWVKITLNMLDYTYKVEALGNASPYLYVVGSHQGWSPETAPIVYSTDFMNYEGYVYMPTGNEFKFTSERSWDGTNYGSGGEGLLSTDGGAGNLNVTNAGFYLLKANTATLTWSATNTVWGLIGDATENEWASSTPMNLDTATGDWTVITTLKDGTFKFRANNEWEINLGGDITNLTYGGDNIQVTAGVYKITLSISNVTVYKCTIVQQ